MNSPADLAGTRSHPFEKPYATITFRTSNAMPHLVYQACLATKTVSNTAYYQRAVAEALARDLGLDLDDLLAALPPHRGPAAHLYNPDEHTMSRSVRDRNDGGRLMIGPANTHEEVR